MNLFFMHLNDKLKNILLKSPSKLYNMKQKTSLPGNNTNIFRAYKKTFGITDF